MPNPKLRLGFREPEIDTNRPFVDGTVKVEGFDLEISNFRGPEFIDAWDASFGGLMQTKGKGEHPYVSIPAFPNRKFRLAYIYVNSAAGIASPRDLEGKRVFVSSTAGIWARGALLNHYKVDFTRIHWFMPGPKAKSWAPGIHVEALPKLSGPNVARSTRCCSKGSWMRSSSRTSCLPSAAGTRECAACSRITKPKSKTISKDRHLSDQPHGDVEARVRRPIPTRAGGTYSKRIAKPATWPSVDLEGANPQILMISWVAASVDEQRAVMGENYWAYKSRTTARHWKR